MRYLALAAIMMFAVAASAVALTGIMTTASTPAYAQAQPKPKASSGSCFERCMNRTGGARRPSAAACSRRCSG